MSQCIKTLGIIIWDEKGGKQGVLHGVQSNPNNFLADILHFWEGGSTQFGNFPKIHGICSVLSSHYDTSAAPVAQDQLYSIYGKSLISQNIRSIFVNFQFFSTQFHWWAFFFSNLKSESRDQMNVGKVQSVQINSVVFMLGVLGAHELFQINSHFCPVYCPLPLIFLPSNFAFSFALFHICPIFCPHFLPLPLPSFL